MFGKWHGYFWLLLVRFTGLRRKICKVLSFCQERMFKVTSKDGVIAKDILAIKRTLSILSRQPEEYPGDHLRDLARCPAPQTQGCKRRNSYQTLCPEHSPRVPRLWTDAWEIVSPQLFLPVFNCPSSRRFLYLCFYWIQFLWAADFGVIHMILVLQAHGK